MNTKTNFVKNVKNSSGLYVSETTFIYIFYSSPDEFLWQQNKFRESATYLDSLYLHLYLSLIRMVFILEFSAQLTYNLTKMFKMK